MSFRSSTPSPGAALFPLPSAFFPAPPAPAPTEAINNLPLTSISLPALIPDVSVSALPSTPTRGATLNSTPATARAATSATATPTTTLSPSSTATPSPSSTAQALDDSASSGGPTLGDVGMVLGLIAAGVTAIALVSFVIRRMKRKADTRRLVEKNFAAGQMAQRESENSRPAGTGPGGYSAMPFPARPSPSAASLGANPMGQSMRPNPMGQPYAPKGNPYMY